MDRKHAQQPEADLADADAPPDMPPAAVADYIAAMSAELSAMARASKLDHLSYFLEMARHEALERARSAAQSPDR